MRRFRSGSSVGLAFGTMAQQLTRGQLPVATRAVRSSVGARPACVIGPLPFLGCPQRPRASRQLSLRPYKTLLRAAAPAAVAAAAAAPASNSSQGEGPEGPLATLSKLSHVAVIAAAAWALLQRLEIATALLQPQFSTTALGVGLLSAGLTVMVEKSLAGLAPPARGLPRFAVQLLGMPALGYALSQLLGLPLASSVGLCLLSCSLGGLLAALQPQSTAAAALAPAAAAPAAAAQVAAATATKAAFKVELPEAQPVAVASWDNPEERLAFAPPSVQAFIARWGRREGIDGVATAALDAKLSPEQELEAKMARMALAPASVQAFIQRWGERKGIDDAHAVREAAERLRLGGVVTEAACGLAGPTPEEAAARLALAPPSVQEFILRWGRREGIDARTTTCVADWAVLETIDEVPGHHQESAAEAAFREQAEGATAFEPAANGAEDPTKAAARLALAPSTVQEFIKRWGRREGIEAAAAV